MQNNPDQVEISAKSVEEAIEVALKELGAERAEATIEVLSQGRTGIFGIRSEQARVRVTRLSVANTVAVDAIETVTQLLKRMEVSATATLSSPGDDQEGPAIDIQGEDSGLLIGKRGETLQALQFLVNLMLTNKGDHPLVVIDVEEYKERRTRALQSMAARVAERVTTGGRAITLEPMPSAERRIIHIALSDHPSVFTESVGSGYMRKVSIIPRR